MLSAGMLEKLREQRGKVEKNAISEPRRRMHRRRKRCVGLLKTILPISPFRYRRLLRNLRA